MCENVDALLILLFLKCETKITSFGVELLCSVKSFESSSLESEAEDRQLTYVWKQNRKQILLVWFCFENWLLDFDILPSASLWSESKKGRVSLRSPWFVATKFMTISSVSVRRESLLVKRSTKASLWSLLLGTTSKTVKTQGSYFDNWNFLWVITTLWSFKMYVLSLDSSDLSSLSCFCIN